MPKTKALARNIDVESRIHEFRGHKVILDADLAEMYGVETKAFNQAIKRNIQRFPKTFMFKLTKAEAETCRDMRSQIVTASKRNIRYLPNAFTEHGVLMAANVLKSRKAVDISIQIVEAFMRMRQMLVSYAELSRKLIAMEKKYDKQFQVVFKAVKQLMVPPEPKRKQIGFEGKH